MQECRFDEFVETALLVKRLCMYNFIYTYILYGLPRWLSGKESACNAEDVGSIPRLRRSSAEEHGNTFQYFCLGTPMNRGAWRAIVHGVTRVRHDLVTKSLPPPPYIFTYIYIYSQITTLCVCVYICIYVYIFVYIYLWIEVSVSENSALSIIILLNMGQGGRQMKKESYLLGLLIFIYLFINILLLVKLDIS